MADRNVRVIIRASPYDSLYGLHLIPQRSSFALCRKPQTHPIHHADKIQHSVEKVGRWSVVHKKFPY